MLRMPEEVLELQVLQVQALPKLGQVLQVQVQAQPKLGQVLPEQAQSMRAQGLREVQLKLEVHTLM